LVNCIRYFPTQALNFTFKDEVNVLFVEGATDTYFVKFIRNIVAGGIAGALSLFCVYSLDSGTRVLEMTHYQLVKLVRNDSSVE
jgi:solute carrier family 25 (adenine nucleotide translocator) protein 4/5/6/31